PDTYGYATTASSSVISGVVSKAYIFLAIKIIYRVIGIDVIKSTHILDMLFVFGLCGIIAGSLQAIKENNLNRMIAFSSAAQIGYIFVGIGLGTAAGTIAAIFHMLTHALTKPLLFTAADGLIDATGNKKDFLSLQGSAHRNKIAGFGFAVGAISMVGLPVFAGFVSKLLFATAAVECDEKTLITLIVLAISTILNTIYFLRTVIRIYTPALPENIGIYSPIKMQTGFT
ncbi:MAG: proton-conducting transporter membrane subunit, partial [Clostridia bacterium]